MKQLIFLLLLAFTAQAQTPEIYYRIDSSGVSTWYFTRQVVTSEATGNKVVQEYRTFFASKAAAQVAADTALAVNRRDSIAARRTLVATDSIKARIARAKNKPVGDAGFKSVRPGSVPETEVIEAPPIITKTRKKRRPKPK
jgi:hypothetical protein